MDKEKIQELALKIRKALNDKGADLGSYSNLIIADVLNQSLSQPSPKEEEREEPTNWHKEAVKVFSFANHPATCDRHSNRCELKHQTGKEGVLKRTDKGLVCPCGDYIQ